MRKYLNNETAKIREVVAAFIHFFGIGILIYLILHKAIIKLQILLFQNSEEMLIGVGRLAIPVILLSVCLSYFINMVLFSCEKKYFPKLWNYFNLGNEKIKINERFIKKLTFLVIILAFFCIFLAYYLLNGYICLGKNYIVVSLPSFSSNRKEYAYSDIKIYEEIHKEGTVRNWVYVYEFPGGEWYSDLGDIFESKIKIVKEIQKRQLYLGIDISEVKEITARINRPKLFNNLSYLLWGLSFFLISWFVKRMFSVKNR